MTIYFPNICVCYLKLLSVSNWVISLYRSSLKVENTFKSFTSMSTALDLSCLIIQIKTVMLAKQKVTRVTKYRISIHYTKVPIKSFQILLLPYFKKYLHRVSVVVHFSISREIFLNLIPFTGMNFFLKIPHIEVKARFLLKPTKYQFHIKTESNISQILYT